MLYAMKYLFLPWFYKRLVNGKSIKVLENWLVNFFGVKNVITIDSARSALLVGLRASNIGVGDEVIVQGFTCIVVINAIKQSGAKPIYVDIDQTLNLDIPDLNKKITNKTKAIIVQHTFGNPANMGDILEICNQKNIKLIEDCAHAFGVEYEGKKLGTIGDMAILSFGSDKCISCVRGGALITNNDELAKKAKDIIDKLPNPDKIHIVQNLMHYIVFFKGKILYSIFLGKIILAISKKLHITGRVIYDAEKKGQAINFYPAKMANCLADLLLVQLNDLDTITKHRKTISQIYTDNINNNKIIKPLLIDGSIPLRYNILTKDPDRLIDMAKKQNIILGNWYRGVVAPLDIDMTNIDYVLGSCPIAEDFANRSVNLPTNININKSDAMRIVEVINQY